MDENTFNAIANSYEDELDKLAYAELIKKTLENMLFQELTNSSNYRKRLKSLPDITN
ncbi:hypothetical protein HYE25_00885 [Mycoplasmopsis bovis]|nr:hypothetical protein [Mycoplasmopsis bovis]QQH23402.1 hypothetical protein HYE25_00885 [Mycoplasmopsis bovis]